jgi:hypothetical protein
MDIRHEFSELLDKYGHHILLVHSNRRMRCSCWNDLTQEASNKCPICFGIGYTPIIEKHLCREKYGLQSEPIAQRFEYGGNISPAKCFYFKHDVGIRSKDLIIDIQFDRKGMPLLSDYYVYEVSFVEPIRGEGGEIEYKRIYTNMDTISMKILVANIRRTGNKEIYNLGMRRIDNE